MSLLDEIRELLFDALESPDPDEEPKPEPKKTDKPKRKRASTKGAK